MRDVIFHYHIFKNAGTSIDASLSGSFGSGWLSFDPDPVWTNVTTGQSLEVIDANPDLRALSSHQLRWPEPSGAELRVYPVVLLRHPIDRIHSIYTYGLRTEESTATGKTFPEYVDWLLSSEGGIVAKSFQTLFLSDDDDLRTFPDDRPTSVTTAHDEAARHRIDSLEVLRARQTIRRVAGGLGRWLAPAFATGLRSAVRGNVCARPVLVGWMVVGQARWPRTRTAPHPSGGEAPTKPTSICGGCSTISNSGSLIFLAAPALATDKRRELEWGYRM